MVRSKVCFGGSSNKAYCCIEPGVCKKQKDESEVLGLSNWMGELGCAKIGLEVGLDGAEEADFQHSGSTVTVSAILDRDGYYTSKSRC